jgi:FHS family L-fucose permease-like MFS transporter
MPSAPIETTTITSTENSGKSYVLAFSLVTSLFFLWGIANTLNGTLIKHFQTALDLERWQAGIIDSAFYFGYFVMALPAAFIMNRWGYKTGIILGLFLFSFGAALFYPAAEVREYWFFLVALFIIACGLAFLETAANPYVTILGEPAGAHKRINFAQSFNGLSTIVAPVIGSLFIFSTTEHTNEMLKALPPAEALQIRIEEAHSVQMPYLVLSGVVMFIVIMFSLVAMPEPLAKANISMKGIFRHKHLIWGIIAQFFYVGAQTAVWGWFIDLKLFYARDEHLGIVKAIYQVTSEMTPTQIASYHASFGFILFMSGRFIGTWLLTKFRAERMLTIYALSCLILLGTAYFANGLFAVSCLLLSYFFMSIMFPTIFSLSIKNLGNQINLGGSFVIMAIIGGGVLPPLMGLVSQTGMRNSLIVPWVALLFALYFGWRGHKVKEA